MKTHSGTYILISGCMFAGKTSRLIELSGRYTREMGEVAVYHPDIDTRNQVDLITSHDQVTLMSRAVSVDGHEIRACASPVILIDEIQFFTPSVVDVIVSLVASGKTVITAGLDTNYRGEYFKTSLLLEPYADEIVRLTARCTVCGAAATRTQRLQNGLRGSTQDVEILPGGSDLYEARCVTCFVPPTDAPITLLQGNDRPVVTT